MGNLVLIFTSHLHLSSEINERDSGGKGIGQVSPEKFSVVVVSARA